MSTMTTTTTTRDRGDRYGPIEWAQLGRKQTHSSLCNTVDISHRQRLSYSSDADYILVVPHKSDFVTFSTLFSRPTYCNCTLQCGMCQTDLTQIGCDTVQYDTDKIFITCLKDGIRISLIYCTEKKKQKY